MPPHTTSSELSTSDYNTWRHEVSKKNLENARGQARQERGYNSARTRQTMDAELARRTGMNAREWQLDAAEAFVLGLDCTIIAGTEAGKTIPMLLPSLLPEYRKKVTVALSPLKALQRDQVCFDYHPAIISIDSMLQTQRFRRAGVSALAVNGDTWSKEIGEVSQPHGTPGAVLTHAHPRRSRSSSIGPPSPLRRCF